MALADWNAFLTQTQRGDAQRVRLWKGSTIGPAARSASTWLVPPIAGSAPTTAAVPTRATTGSHPFDAWTDPASLATFCIGGELAAANINSAGGGSGGLLMLVDRLSHQGGLSGTTTTAQTTNLPTAALTRFTTGEGVWIGLEIYTAVGATATTVSASYTNQAGTSGQTTPLTTFGGTNYNAAQRIIPLPLATGDTGVRAVASVTVTASTLTAGNFGVTLFKPIAVFATLQSQEQFDPFTAGNMVGLTEIPDNACLQFVWWSHGNAGQNICGDLVLGQV